MKEELIKFIRENEITPFNGRRITEARESIYKTRDAKTIHNKVISKVSQNFYFESTPMLLTYLDFIENIEEIKKRQNYFKQIIKKDNNFLKEIVIPKPSWRPKYNILVVTENEKTFLELKDLDCPVQFANSSNDLSDFENYDIIQVIDCDELSTILERLPQTIFLNSIEEVYLERYLRILSGWKQNLEILKQNPQTEDMNKLVLELYSLFNLIDDKTLKKISKDEVEDTINRINDSLLLKIKEMTISGESLFKMLSKNSLPPEIQEIIKNEIEKTKLPSQIFNQNVPLTLDEKEFNELIRKQEIAEHTDLAEIIRRKAKEIKEIPEKLERLQELLLITDFNLGISKFIKEQSEYINQANELLILDSENIFLENPQKVSFILNEQWKCSILTGANSGGKTTLLEHIIQLISLFYLGLPVIGKITMPLFSEVYYFAKNKGSASKGAFETLLEQMSKIKPGKKTLILADEIEAVTEPGVAGKIIAATSEYFINKDCFLVIATHLGHEIKNILPKLSRIDGIEAKGLDENFDLIVNHNPVLGRLANSTPELIVEKLANAKKEDYFIYLHNNLKNPKI